MISSDYVVAVHDEILKETNSGCEGCHIEKLEGALSRVEQQLYYNNTDDVFEKAAWYGVALAKGHAFVDCNKRTALSVMLTVLKDGGMEIPDKTGLDDLMVEIADSGNKHGQNHEAIVADVADFLSFRAEIAKDDGLNKEYKIDFSYNKEASTPDAKAYNVLINDKPVSDVLKSDPNVIKVIEGLANQKDLVAQGVTLESLKTGVITPQKQDSQIIASRPSSRVVNASGSNVAAKEKSNKGIEL